MPAACNGSAPARSLDVVSARYQRRGAPSYDDWNRLRSTPPGKTTSRTVKFEARRIARQDERVVLVAQKTGRSHRRISCRSHFRAGHTAASTCDRPARGPSQRHKPDTSQGRIERMARQHVSVGNPVRPVLGVPRANDRVLVLVLRQLRKRVAERDPRYVRRNRSEFAPDLLGCLGLGVKAVDMADSALQPEQDARDVLAAPAAGPCLCSRKPGSEIPSAASEPTLSNSRRVTRSQLRCKPIVKLSIAPSPGTAPQG